MSIVLYDLKGRDGLRFSPFGWRVRLALAHKGLVPEDVGVGFTEKDRIAFSGQGLVPVIVDRDRGGKVVNDSWAIACYLEDAYPERPLFGGAPGRALARFVDNWTGQTVAAGIIPLVIADLFQRVRPQDQAYFRQSREKRFGRPLEEVQAGRETRLEAFRARLEPLRAQLRQHPFVSGDAPAYPDYTVFSVFQWARLASDFELLAKDDILAAWRERMLDLHDGLGRTAVTGPVD